MSIRKTLYREIKGAKLSATQLARKAKITQQSLSAFLAGADSRLSTIEKLANYFGLKLTGPKKARRARGK